MNVVENVCSIVAMPVEMVLRPQYGTRYFPVPVVFFSAVMMIFLPLFSAVADGRRQHDSLCTAAETPAACSASARSSRLYFLLSFIQASASGGA